MRHSIATILVSSVLTLLLSTNAFAQQEGDYRSAARGNWSDVSTWEVFESGAWVAATTAPTGSETITIAGEDTVTVDTDVSITDTVVVSETGVLAVDGGTLTFADGGVYQHDRNAGSVPSATWEEGSTILITGVTEDPPDNRGQDYHHIVLNTPGLSGNEHLSLSGATVSGDIRVIDTGSARWYLTSANADDSVTVTIMGDVIVENGQFAVHGTGNANTKFVVQHYGDINVTGGNFSIARGSQGSGSGTTTWNLLGGDFLMSDATTQNSNPTPGNAKFVFAGADTLLLTFENVEYASGNINFEVSDSTTLQITSDFVLDGLFVNRGEVEALGEFVVSDGAVYEHARNGGAVPSATWEEGSTFLVTGVTQDAPDNMGQDYHHVVINTPDLSSNEQMSLAGATVHGDIHVIDTGTARWYLASASAQDSAVVTLMGDVIVENGQFAVHGTSNALTTIIVNHYGNINVTGGNLSIARGSQGEGSGTTTWNLYQGNFSMSDAASQNSNPTPGNAKFVFASDTVQVLTLGGENNITNLPIEVLSGATLDMGVSELGGSGVFVLNEGAALATAHAEGVAGAIQTTGDVTLADGASFIFNGTEAQVTSTLMPAVVQDLLIENEAGVTLTQETTINGILTLRAGAFDNTIPFTLGPEGSIVIEEGSLVVPVSIEALDEIPTEFALYQNYPNPFNPSTVIRYDVSATEKVSIKVYDITGREVAELVNETHVPGAYQIEWNASNLTSGVYLYRIRAGEWTATRSLLLVK